MRKTIKKTEKKVEKWDDILNKKYDIKEVYDKVEKEFNKMKSELSVARA